MTQRARHILGAPLEQVGGGLERLLGGLPAWDVGLVERERGRIEATVYGGWLRGATLVTFNLTVMSDASTQLEVVIGAGLWGRVTGGPRRAVSEVLQALRAQLAT